MHVKVTAEHIRLGEQGSSCRCPIARAIKDALPEPHGAVGVLGRLAFVGNSTYKLPQEAQAFVIAFDSDSAVEPFEFDLVPLSTAGDKHAVELAARMGLPL